MDDSQIVGNSDEFNKDYISIKTTRIINGLFVLIIFFSHSFQYYIVENEIAKRLSHFIQIDFGQLMVTSFLFYSGFGIFESYKKKNQYLDSFVKKRLIATYLKFIMAWILYLIIYIFQGKVSKIRVIVSLLLWDTIGNSNWYIFMILLLYTITYIFFRVFKNELHKVNGVFISSFIVVVLFSFIKPNYWSNTIMCYIAGMFYSLYKTKMEQKIYEKKEVYTVVLFSVVLSFIIIRFLYDKLNINYKVIKNLIYNVISVLFVYGIVLVSMKTFLFEKFSILEWLGKNCFWIYILQRIPMIIIKKDNYFMFILFSFIITCLLASIFSKIYDKLFKKVVKE